MDHSLIVFRGNNMKKIISLAFFATSLLTFTSCGKLLKNEKKVRSLSETFVSRATLRAAFGSDEVSKLKRLCDGLGQKKNYLLNTHDGDSFRYNYDLQECNGDASSSDITLTLLSDFQLQDLNGKNYSNIFNTSSQSPFNIICQNSTPKPIIYVGINRVQSIELNEAATGAINVIVLEGTKSDNSTIAVDTNTTYKFINYAGIPMLDSQIVTTTKCSEANKFKRTVYSFREIINN